MIVKAAASGVLVFGVCGGYQMLGWTISDPHVAEGDADGVMNGMRLLPIDIVFEKDKTRKFKED